MKTLGLLGGMSFESTITYYKIINEVVKEKLGGLHSAKILLYSVNFAEIEQCQAQGHWDESASILSNAARKLEKAGADIILICTNTMHKVAPQIQNSISIPLLHIADATAKTLQQHDIKKAALLGTKYTMEDDFLKKILQNSEIDILIPNSTDRVIINDIIFNELCLGKKLPSSKQAYIDIIKKLEAQGAQGIILGCTEIGLLIQQADVQIPLFDTTEIHAKAAAIFALE